jgi:hypothetical protein
MGLLTKISAVNRILQASGKSPVSTLGGTDTSAALLAERELDSAVRRIQTQGLSYNTTTKKYSPDSNGRISLPSNTLSADGAYTNYECRYGVRGGSSPYLYDMNNDTDVFTEDVYLKVVRLLPFEDIPDADQEWATDMAAVVYQMNNVQENRPDLEQMAAMSRAKARQEECRRLDVNILDSSSSERLGARRGFRRPSW